MHSRSGVESNQYRDGEMTAATCDPCSPKPCRIGFERRPKRNTVHRLHPCHVRRVEDAAVPGPDHLARDAHLRMPPLPRRRRVGLAPQTSLRGPGLRFEPGKLAVTRRELAIPPGHPLTDPLAVQRPPLRKDHLGDGPPVAVLVHDADGHVFAERHLRRRLLRLRAEVLDGLGASTPWSRTLTWLFSAVRTVSGSPSDSRRPWP